LESKQSIDHKWDSDVLTADHTKSISVNKFSSMFTFSNRWSRSSDAATLRNSPLSFHNECVPCGSYSSKNAFARQPNVALDLWFCAWPYPHPSEVHAGDSHAPAFVVLRAFPCRLYPRRDFADGVLWASAGRPRSRPVFGPAAWRHGDWPRRR